MKWIKANKRLPKKDGEYICKHYYEGCPEVFSGVCTLEFKEGGFWLDDVLHHIHWLDESPSAPVDQEGQEEMWNEIGEILKAKWTIQGFKDELKNKYTIIKK